jgi:hypothetical protein
MLRRRSRGALSRGPGGRNPRRHQPPVRPGGTVPADRAGTSGPSRLRNGPVGLGLDGLPGTPAADHQQYRSTRGSGESPGAAPAPGAGRGLAPGPRTSPGIDSVASSPRVQQARSGPPAAHQLSVGRCPVPPLGLAQGRPRGRVGRGLLELPGEQAGGLGVDQAAEPSGLGRALLLGQ